MWEEDANVVHGSRWRIRCASVSTATSCHAAALNGTLLPPVEQGGGMPKSDHHRDNKVIADDGRDAREILGRGGNDNHLPPQSVASAKARRKDATRGLVQQEASSTSSPSVRLHRIHEGRASPPCQARSQGAEVVFICYEPESKAYRLYDPAGGGGSSCVA